MFVKPHELADFHPLAVLAVLRPHPPELLVHLRDQEEDLEEVTVQAERILVLHRTFLIAYIEKKKEKYVFTYFR